MGFPKFLSSRCCNYQACHALIATKKHERESPQSAYLGYNMIRVSAGPKPRPGHVLHCPTPHDKMPPGRKSITARRKKSRKILDKKLKILDKNGPACKKVGQIVTQISAWYVQPCIPTQNDLLAGRSLRGWYFFWKLGLIFCKVGDIFCKVGLIFLKVVVFLLKVVADLGF